LKPKGLRQKINNNYDMHKTLSLLQIIILNLNKIKNIGGDKILAPTKHWWPQNIGADKIHASTKLLASTKLSASTKYWRQQNTGVDKISALTKSWRQQKAGANKMLAQQKCWSSQNVGADAEESPYCLARQSPQLLTSPRPC
jgi:hypothetical protein